MKRRGERGREILQTVEVAKQDTGRGWFHVLLRHAEWSLDQWDQCNLHSSNLAQLCSGLNCCFSALSLELQSYQLDGLWFFGEQWVIENKIVRYIPNFQCSEQGTSAASVNTSSCSSFHLPEMMLFSKVISIINKEFYPKGYLLSAVICSSLSPPLSSCIMYNFSFSWLGFMRKLFRKMSGGKMILWLPVDKCERRGEGILGRHTDASPREATCFVLVRS